jgi:TM2 domain-containing membrane protein YozV
MRKVMVLGVAVVVLLVSTLGASAQTTDAWIPGLASFVIPGVGQFINDQVDKAILHFVVAVGLDVGVYYLAALLPFGYYSYPLVGLAHLGWALYSGFDAYNVAKDQGFQIGFVDNGLGFQVNF